MRLRVAAVPILIVFFLCASPSSASAQQAGQTSLRSLRDQARPLLIFAPAADDKQLGIQLRTLQEHAAEVQDRQIVPIALPYQGAAPSAVALSALQLSADEAAAVRSRFHVNPGDFVVILIGKDGGAKLRSAKPLAMRTLNETIDAMPMRQDEMQGKTQR